MKYKIFSLQEANELTNQIRPKLIKLAEKKSRMHELHDQLLTLELIQEEKNNFYESPEGAEYLQHSKQLEDLILSFEVDLNEIRGLGCILRDIEKGALDFYHVVEDILVFLCWNVEDEGIQYWREVDKSIVEKKPIEDLKNIKKD